MLYTGCRLCCCKTDNRQTSQSHMGGGGCYEKAVENRWVLRWDLKTGNDCESLMSWGREFQSFPGECSVNKPASFGLKAGEKAG